MASTSNDSSIYDIYVLFTKTRGYLFIYSMIEFKLWHPLYDDHFLILNQGIDWFLM